MGSSSSIGGSFFTFRFSGCSKNRPLQTHGTLRIRDHFSYNQAHLRSSQTNSNLLFTCRGIRTRVARDRPSNNNEQQQPVIHTGVDTSVPHD